MYQYIFVKNYYRFDPINIPLPDLSTPMTVISQNEQQAQAPQNGCELVAFSHVLLVGGERALLIVIAVCKVFLWRES